MLRKIFMLADKSTLREAMLLFEMKILPFSGILGEVRSIVEITKGVQSKILDHKFLKLWTYQPPSPLLSLSLSAHRGWYTSIVHPVLISRVYCCCCFFFIRILIDHYPLSKEEFNKNSSGSHFEYSLMECTHVLSPWCQTKAALMRTSTNNPLFSSYCTTWLIHVHPTWSEETILAVLHIIPLDMQFRHIQRHVREHVNIFQCPLHVMDACQNCVTMDAMAGNQGTKQKCTN